MIYPSYYTNPALVSLQLEKADPGVVPIEAVSEYQDYYANVRLFCQQASEYITHQTGRVFVPYRHTYRARLDAARLRMAVAYQELALPDDLLLETEVRYNDTLLEATEYELVSALLYDVPPYYALRLRQMTGYGELAISGWWGYGRGLGQAFEVIEAITGTLSDSATSVLVADGARYQVYQTLKVEDELMLITDIFGDELIVLRGQRGTEAAAHTDYTIRRAVVEPAIVLAATRLAANLYQRRNDAAGRIQFADGSMIINELPPMVKETLSFYRRLGAMSA